MAPQNMKAVGGKVEAAGFDVISLLGRNPDL